MKKEDAIQAVLGRYGGKVYPSLGEVVKALQSRKLTIYHGVDPTAPQLHLGHATNYFLLRGLQDLGHKVILLIGDFTAQIGDPTGKSQTRKPLTPQEVLQNSKTYREQAGKILDFSAKRNPVSLKYNSAWLSKMTFADVVRVAARTTVNQMIQRDMFQERIKTGHEIYLHEFLYPLMQGYDSVAMNVDAEVGGTDQTFNMLIGRDLVRALKKKEKFVITTPLLVDPKTGGKLMSKSKGGYVALNDPPDEMYGKIMALPDETVFPCLRLCTRVPLEKIEKMEKAVENKKLSWRNAKAFLARINVEMYHSGKEAEAAEKEFVRVFQKGELPSRMQEVKASHPGPLPLYKALAELFSLSGAEARRVIEQGGARVNGTIQKNPSTVIRLRPGTIIQVGPRRTLSII
jgi:tyrosyl-tRNA synthetase